MHIYTYLYTYIYMYIHIYMFIYLFMHHNEYIKIILYISSLREIEY